MPTAWTCPRCGETHTALPLVLGADPSSPGCIEQREGLPLDAVKTRVHALPHGG